MYINESIRARHYFIRRNATLCAGSPKGMEEYERRQRPMLRCAERYFLAEALQRRRAGRHGVVAVRSRQAMQRNASGLESEIINKCADLRQQIQAINIGATKARERSTAEPVPEVNALFQWSWGCSRSTIHGESTGILFEEPSPQYNCSLIAELDTAGQSEKCWEDSYGDDDNSMPNIESIYTEEALLTDVRSTDEDRSIGTILTATLSDESSGRGGFDMMERYPSECMSETPAVTRSLIDSGTGGLSAFEMSSEIDTETPLWQAPTRGSARETHRQIDTHDELRHQADHTGEREQSALSMAQSLTDSSLTRMSALNHASSFTDMNSTLTATEACTPSPGVSSRVCEDSESSNGEIGTQSAATPAHVEDLSSYVSSSLAFGTPVPIFSVRFSPFSERSRDFDFSILLSSTLQLSGTQQSESAVRSVLEPSPVLVSPSPILVSPSFSPPSLTLSPSVFTLSPSWTPLAEIPFRESESPLSSLMVSFLPSHPVVPSAVGSAGLEDSLSLSSSEGRPSLEDSQLVMPTSPVTAPPLRTYRIVVSPHDAWSPPDGVRSSPDDVWSPPDGSGKNGRSESRATTPEFIQSLRAKMAELRDVFQT